MPITGVYDGSVVKVDDILPINQKVIVIPYDEDDDPLDAVGGMLHQYANPSLIEQESEAWRKAAIEKHASI